jgi:carboxylate-amine ligase
LPIREDVMTTLRKLAPYAEMLGSQPALDHFYLVTHIASDAHFLRQEYAATGSTEGMVNAALRCFRDESK